MSQQALNVNPVVSDAKEDLFYLINSSNKIALDESDFVKFYESRNDKEHFEINPEKIRAYEEPNSNAITLESFKNGCDKEIQRVGEELKAISERIVLDEGIIKDFQKNFEAVKSSVDKDDQPKLFLTVLEAKNMEFMQKIVSRISVVIQGGNNTYSTTNATYAGDQATWVDQKFTIPIVSEIEPIIVNIIDIEENEGNNYVGGFAIDLQTLRDQQIHKRTYKAYVPDSSEITCEIVLRALYVHDRLLYEEGKLSRRQKAFALIHQRNCALRDQLVQKYNNLQNAQGVELLGELISNDVEMSSFPSPVSFNRQHGEDSEYGSETASIYDNENQIEIFLNGNDEEKVVFHTSKREVVALSPNSLLKLKDAADLGFEELGNKSFEDEKFYAEYELPGSSQKKSLKSLPQLHLSIEKIHQEAKVSEFVADSLLQNHNYNPTNNGNLSFTEDGNENEALQPLDNNPQTIDSLRICEKTLRQRVLSPIGLNISNVQSTRSYAESNVSSTRNYCTMLEEKEKHYFESNKKPTFIYEVQEVESHGGSKRNEASQVPSGRPVKSKEELMNEALLRGIARLMIADKKKNAVKNENTPALMKKGGFAMSTSMNKTSAKHTLKRLV